MSENMQTAAQTDTGAAAGSAQAAPQGAQTQQATDPGSSAQAGAVLNSGQTQAPAQAQTGNWRDALPQDLRGHEALKDIQDPSALAKAFVEAQGKAPQVPAEYVINTPAGAKVDTAVADAAKTLAREIGLTQPQLDALVRFDANRAQVYAQGKVDKATTAHAALQQELGAGATAYFEQANSGYRAFASPELKALIDNDPVLCIHPGLIRHFHAIGALVKEGKLPMGPGAGREKTLAETLYPSNA